MAVEPAPKRIKLTENGDANWIPSAYVRFLTTPSLFPSFFSCPFAIEEFIDAVVS